MFLQNQKQQSITSRVIGTIYRVIGTVIVGIIATVIYLWILVTFFTSIGSFYPDVEGIFLFVFVAPISLIAFMILSWRLLSLPSFRQKLAIVIGSLAGYSVGAALIFMLYTKQYTGYELISVPVSFGASIIIGYVLGYWLATPSEKTTKPKWLLVPLFLAIIAIILSATIPTLLRSRARQAEMQAEENEIETWFNNLPPYGPTEMITIPAGVFLMGVEYDTEREAEYAREGGSAYGRYLERVTDESPIHEVYLDIYLIDKTEVTVAQYAACVIADVCDFSRGRLSDSDYDYPMISVTWNEAQTYCEWQGKRLPTEAEWEKAARGTDGRLFPWGNEGLNCNLANFGSHCYQGLLPVGSLPDGASPYGVLDMIGHPVEWVNDWYDPEYYTYSPEDNPQGPEEGPIIEHEHIVGGIEPTHERTVRGGYSEFDSVGLRFWGEDEVLDEEIWSMFGTFQRDGQNPDRGSAVGFRCAASP